MADTKISAMTAATAATASTVPVVQGGVNKKLSMTGAGAAMIEAADAAAQRTLLSCPGLATANIFSANGAASTPALSLTGTILTGQTGTTNFPHFYIQPTGTTAATTLSTAGTAFGANMPSGFAGDYLHFFNAGARALRIACGNFNIPTFYGDATYNYIYFNATVQINNEPLYVAGSVLGLSNSGRTTGAHLDGADTAGLLSQKRATTPCEFDIYGTFTDASNYERMVLRTAAGVYSIKPEAAGTGTLRDLHISGLPTSNPGPGILWNNLGIPAIGT